MKGFFTASAAYILSATLLRLVGAGVTIWLATQMSDAEYGRFGLAWALQQLVTVATLGGISEAVIGRAPQSVESSARARLFAEAQLLFVGISAGVSLIALCWVAVGFNPRVRGIEIFSVVSYGVTLSYSTLLSGLSRLNENHVVSILFATLPPMAGLAGGYAGFKITGTLVGFFLGSTVSCLLPLIVTRRLAIFAGAGAHPAPTLSGARALFSVSAPFAASALFGWLSGMGNNVLIERFFPLEEVGHYTLTLSFASAVQMIAAAMNSVWSPRFYQLATRMAALELEEANRAFYGVLSILLGGAGGVLLILVPVLGSLLGKNLALGHLAGLGLAFMVVGYVLATTWWQCSNHLLAAGAGRVVLSVTVFTGLVGTLAWIGLMLFLGPPGIYVGFAVMMMLRSFFLKRATAKYVTIRWPWKGIATGSGLVLVGWLASLTGQPLILQVVSYGVIGFGVLVLVARRDLRRYASRWQPNQ